jgi:acyl-CoA dehydrogenase
MTMRSALREAIEDSFERLLSTDCSSAVVRAIEAHSDHTALWESITASGFMDALVPLNKGGSGLSLSDAVAIPLLCGAHAVPVPVAETMLLRGLLSGDGYTCPPGSLTMARGFSTPSGGIYCPQTSLGLVADWVIVAAEDGTLVLPVREATVGAASFTLDAAFEWSPQALQASPILPNLPIDLALAFVCAVQLSGAMLATLARTVTYANERVQFGRPIGKFQAIQQDLTVMAEAAYSARMAVELCAGTGCDLDPLRIAVAKARCSEAAVRVASVAHAVHGAIGFTEEYDLQLWIRRLSAWRRTGGSEAYWQRRLGAALLADPRPGSLDFLRSLSDALV